MTIQFLNKTGRTWLAAALPLCGTLMSSPALAVDAVGGSATNVDIGVNGAGWTILRSVTFSNPTQRYCTATGSADALRPLHVDAPAESLYYFTVSDTPNPIPDQGQERTLAFWSRFVSSDHSIKEITTTGGWMSQANANPGVFTFAASPVSRTLYFLARKATAATTPNLTVRDASMTVTCTDNRLVPPVFVPTSAN